MSKAAGFLYISCLFAAKFSVPTKREMNRGFFSDSKSEYSLCLRPVISLRLFRNPVRSNTNISNILFLCTGSGALSISVLQPAAITWKHNRVPLFA